MPLNVNGTSTAPVVTDRRRKLARDLVDELSSWNPREFMGMFQRLHKGTLSLIHLNVLTVLDTRGPLSMGRLAEALGVSVASMTGIVGRMEKRGFVERRHDEHDRRVVLVHQTEAGANVFVEIDQRRREGLTKLLGRLSEDEMAGLLNGHRALRVARQKYAASAVGHASESPSTTSPNPASQRKGSPR